MASRTAQSSRSVTTSRPVMISRWRINVVLIVALLIVGRVIIQLGDLQVVQHTRLSAMARSEIDRQMPIQPSRGVIRDRLGNVLALDVDRHSLYVVPSLIAPKDAPRLALVLSGLLGQPAPEILTKLQAEDYYWLPVQRWVEPEIAERIVALQQDDPEMWNGLRFIYEPRRVYPQGSFAAHTIGAVNFEGAGISGVEGFYDSELRGSTGTITAEVDAQNNPIWIAPQETRPASNGADLELTIDPLIQHVIETELKKAVDDHNADGGTVIVIDPKTGAIRGMSSYPTFDPNRYNDYAPEMYNLNPAISKLYEPGSTFKIVTVAAGLQAGAFTPETTVNDSGTIFRYGWNLSNWNGGANGPITPAQVLYYSSNVGALQLSEMTGADKFYQIVADFGFGKTTGVDLAGEEEGIVQTPLAEGWSPLVLNTNGYGQGIAVTPLQHVRMAATVGNDGKVMQPYIVQKRCHNANCEITQPREIKQAIDPVIAARIRQMLIKSANHYVNPAQPDNLWLVPGYAVGAKTGTSSIPDGRGGYGDGTIGSVVGIAPADNARYAILVKIDHPKDDIWGVRTALPVYQAIVEKLMRYERIAPEPTFVGPDQVAGLVSH